ncbi:MAG: response regulator transcription factor [Candidatus Cloacimonetes bacterium]|nr:response regulator transcription factor [Candidatus Cloacimonadota bacterium]
MNSPDTKQNITCIIIDDEQEACDRLECLLEKIPTVNKIVTETDAEKGIEWIINNSFDLVFLDVEMPKKNGFEVVREIRNKNLAPTFIFVTAYAQYAIKAIRNTAFDYLLKPVDIDELKEAINRFQYNREKAFKDNLPAKLKREYSLTDREIEIVIMLGEGKTSANISEQLFISKNTVDTHRRNILEKTHTKNTPDLIAHITTF